MIELLKALTAMAIAGGIAWGIVHIALQIERIEQKIDLIGRRFSYEQDEAVEFEQQNGFPPDSDLTMHRDGTPRITEEN